MDRPGWKIGWLCCCPLGRVLLHARAKRKRRKEGASLPSSFLLQNRSEKEKGRKEEKKRRKLVERVGARDIGVCLLRTRPKNRALKAPRLLETLGATFSIGVWREGECGEIMRRGCHECQYFHYFSTRFREALFEKRVLCWSLLLLLSSFIFHFFPPFFTILLRSLLLPHGKTCSIPLRFFVWSSVAIFLPLKTMWKRGHRGIRGIRIGLTWRAYKVDVKGSKGFGLYFVSFCI